MKLKQNKGITLIALIITIVIMLILAIVTIAAVKGEGIIGKAKKAKSDYQNAQAEEQNIIDQYLAEMEGLIGNNSTGGNNSILGDNSFVQPTPLTEPAIVYAEVSIEEAQQDGMLSRTDNTTTYDVNNKQINIPAGFKILVNETTGYMQDNINVDQGIVITDGTNEFVWVPVETKVEAYGIGTTDYRGPDVIDKECDYNSSSDIDGADNDPTYLNIVNNILGTTYSNSDEFLVALQEDFNAMAESVNKNHGFYVGRYETSLNGSVAQSVKGEISATAAESSANTWYGLYAYQKTYKTSSVQGSMIWGSQYDKMMTWMQNTGTDINSVIGDDRNTDRTTGTKETDKINNVYDLYGNSFEWTLQAHNITDRVKRGGNHCNDYEISIHANFNYSPISADGDNGSRVSLYIK